MADSIICRSRTLYAAVTVLFVVSWTSTSLVAADRFFIPSVGAEAAAAQAAAEVHAEHDIPVSAFSISLRYDPTALTAVEVVELLPLDFFDGLTDTVEGEIAYGGVVDLTAPFTPLPASTDRALVRITFDLLLPSGETTELIFEDGLGGDLPVNNVLTTDAGQSVRPTLDHGCIARGTAVPRALINGAELAPESTDVILDGSTSTPPDAAFSWQQVAGPPAVALAGVDAPQLTVTLPAVEGDQVLTLELTVSGECGTDTDTVNTTAIDVDARRALLTSRAGSTAQLIEGGTRAVVFAADVDWATPLEDALWSRARFAFVGSGDQRQLLSGRSVLYEDVNANRTLDAGDVSLAEVNAFDAGGGFEFSLARTITSAAPVPILLVVDIAPEEPAPTLTASAASPVLLLLVATLLMLAALIPSQYRRLLTRSATIAALLIGFSLIGLPSCSSGGGGGSASAGTGAIQFALQGQADLSITGVNTGVEGQADGLPLNGPPLDL